MIQKIACVMFLVGTIAAAETASADAEAAKTMAGGVCAGCHGPKGVSAGDTFPNLAGQKKQYLANALKAYRDKSRNAPIMNGMAGSLTDQQIDDLAAYFSALAP
jgi:cytochrome c553